MARRTPRTPDPTRRPMGRPITTTSEKTGVYLDSDLKRRLGIEARRRGQTISDLVAEAIRAYLARPKKAQASLQGLDEPTGGQVKGEDAQHERQPERTGT